MLFPIQMQIYDLVQDILSLLPSFIARQWLLASCSETHHFESNEKKMSLKRGIIFKIIFPIRYFKCAFYQLNILQHSLFCQISSLRIFRKVNLEEIWMVPEIIHFKIWMKMYTLCELHTQLWNWPQNFKCFVLSSKKFWGGIYLQTVFMISICLFLFGK